LVRGSGPGCNNRATVIATIFDTTRRGIVALWSNFSSALMQEVRTPFVCPAKRPWPALRQALHAMRTAHFDLRPVSARSGA
jgi:hypothetical protein